MKLFTRFSVISLLVILILGFVLRSYNYKTWPREGATFDEYAWTWLGMSIIDTGIPTSWSPHAQYKTRTYFKNTQGASFFLVTPYLEHPPLFGLVSGAYAKSVGLKEFNDVTIQKIRPLGLFLGILSILAVYLLATQVAGYKTGLLASFLYAIMPSVVVGSRLVQNENFFIPIFLISIFCAVRFQENNNRRLLLTSVLLAAALPLAKVPWMAAPATICALFFSYRRYKEAFLTILATVGFFSCFLLYGFKLDAQLFVNLWSLQLARYDMAFDSMFSIFLNPLVTDRFFLDGLTYLGYIAFFVVAAVKKKDYLPVILGFLAYFSLFLFAIPNEAGHGWYRYPLYPFLIIAIALLIREFFNKNMIISWVILIIPGLASLSNTWQQTFGFSYGTYRIFLIACSFSLLTLIFPQRWLLRFSKFINITMIVFVCGLLIWSGLRYNEQ